jgi:hypothetical protein
MSTNKDWSADEWRSWHARCLAHVTAFEGDHYSEENERRQDALRIIIREKYPKAFNECDGPERWRR